MSIGIRKYFYFAVLVISLVACQVIIPINNDELPTKDVGEQPPTLSTPASGSSTPMSTNTQAEDVGSDDMLVGPAPYPSPSLVVISWEQLVDQTLLKDILWETYLGNLQGIEKGDLWNYTFRYPAAWFADPKPSPQQAFVQNIPVTLDPLHTEFVKFEIVRLDAPPMIEEGHVVNPRDLVTVMVAQEPGIMSIVTQKPSQVRQIMVSFQHDGGWVVAAGYISLSSPDSSLLERSSAIIYDILSSFSFGDQVTESNPIASIPLINIQKKPAEGDFPAAGICGSSPQSLMVITIVSGNMPNPRCIQVRPDQRLRFKNETGETVQIILGQYQATLPPGIALTYDLPCGDYLEPGVHHITLSRGSAPEIWLTD